MPTGNRCARRATFAMVLVGLWMPVTRAASAVDVALISGDTLAIDADDGLTGIYVGYEVANTGPESYDDIWVSLADFTGGIIELAPSASGEYHIGSLSPGETKPAYFYLTAAIENPTPQTHNVRVHVGSPVNVPLTTESVELNVLETLTSNAIHTTGILLSDSPEVGSTFTMVVTGESGTTTGYIQLTPAGFPDWPADVFELVSVTTVIWDGCVALQSTVLDSLLIQRPPGSYCYEISYEFRTTMPKVDPTPVSPVQYIQSGAQIKHGDLDVLCNFTCEIPPIPVPTGIPMDPASAGRFWLDQNIPNPFNPTTTIHFSTHRATRVSLVIYDAAGRRVRTLFNGPIPAGTHLVDWDGLDSDGRQAASGVYFYRLIGDRRSLTRKMLFLK